jgi:hypothetical protein
MSSPGRDAALTPVARQLSVSKGESFLKKSAGFGGPVAGGEEMPCNMRGKGRLARSGASGYAHASGRAGCPPHGISLCPCGVCACWAWRHWRGARGVSGAATHCPAQACQPDPSGREGCQQAIRPRPASPTPPIPRHHGVQPHRSAGLCDQRLW